MADRIEVDYDVLQQVHQKFTQLADEVEQMGKHIGRETLALRDEGWQGEGSDAFYEEMDDKVAPAVRQLREALEHAVKVIGNVAQTMRQAEADARSGLNAVMQ